MNLRSGCPINVATQALGDRWSRVLLRDKMFGEKRTYRDHLSNLIERIATTILVNRLNMLVADVFLTAEGFVMLLTRPICTHSHLLCHLGVPSVWLEPARCRGSVGRTGRNRLV